MMANYSDGSRSARALTRSKCSIDRWTYSNAKGKSEANLQQTPEPSVLFVERESRYSGNTRKYLGGISWS